MKNSLGKKMKFFRKRKGISQTTLETDADLAYGVISRIENDSINPTKETLMKISKMLELNNHELDYLLELQEALPDGNDIKKAVESVRAWLEEELFPMYLLDSRMRGWTYNKMLLEIFGLSEDVAKKYIGENIDKVLFSSPLNILSKVPLKQLYNTIKVQASHTKALTEMFTQEDYTQDIIKELMLNKDFKNEWKEPRRSVDTAMRSNFYLKYKGKTLNILITMYKLFSDSRFLLVEYFPKDTETMKVFEKVRESIKHEKQINTWTKN